VVAAPPASPRSCLPLPPASHPAAMKITIYGWRCATNVEGGSM
jgi:hypothetical protein